MAISASIILERIETDCPDCGASNAVWLWCWPVPHKQGISAIECSCNLFTLTPGPECIAAVRMIAEKVNVAMQRELRDVVRA